MNQEKDIENKNIKNYFSSPFYWFVFPFFYKKDDTTPYEPKDKIEKCLVNTVKN